MFCSLLDQPGNGSDSSSCLPLPPAMPTEGLQAVCREVRLCPLWGFGNLEPHFLPCWDKNLSSLKAREGEGEDLTAGVLQPPVPSDRNVVLCASLPQSLILLQNVGCSFLCLPSFGLLPVWNKESKERIREHHQLMLGVYFFLCVSLLVKYAGYPSATVKLLQLCKLWRQEPDFLQAYFREPTHLPHQEISCQKCVESLFWCCTYQEDFKDVFFTSWWYWGRVSLLPSLIKVADKYLAAFPQCSLWPCCLFQAEEGTKLISCVLPPTYRYWNAVKRLTHQVMCLT